MKLVLDTNIVLDLWVFKDAGAASLGAALAARQVTWLATPAMREELTCVLAYGQLAARLRAADVSAEQVLARFDEHACVVEPPQPSKIVCRDEDDQKFVDLAAAHGATLLSKDKAVLALRRKLAVARSLSCDSPT